LGWRRISLLCSVAFLQLLCRGWQKKQVARCLLGDVNEQSVGQIWMSEDYVCFRSEVRAFHFPSCPDCDLREIYDLRERNEACWSWNPSCADCLWAQDIVRCP
ncbi:MAG TPA: SPASM domain-containing protein, partial [Anaerolineae bacterium]|nr:SPASM domain-containing protein [Anaerolineae bacterium]